MPPSFEEAIHLVSSDSAAGCVKGAGGKKGRVHPSNDRLTIGPCDSDPRRHFELRRAWNDEVGWPFAFGVEDLRSAIADDRPIVLWGTRAFPDLVWLWWVLDGLGHIPAGGQRLVFLARPRFDDPLRTMGGSTREAAHAALAVARPVLGEELREAAELWRHYAAPTPLAFDEARCRGSSVFPELSSSAELHGAWFPRLRGDRLQLAELDELLLGFLGDTSRTIRDLLAERDGEDGVDRLVGGFGALYPITRLRAWAAHGVVAREACANDSPFQEDSFRRTDRTRLLLERGLEQVGDAPPLHVGGCHVNDPAAPWVRIDDDSGWHLGLHGPP